MKKIALLLPISLFIFSCSSSKQEVVTHTDQCASLMQEATNELAEGGTFRAKEILNGVLNDCSGTGFMEDAQYMLAQAYFEDEEWVDSRAEFDLYADHYPNSPRTPNAIYKQALSSYHSPFKMGRDGALTKEGIEEFQEFLMNYPDHPKSDSARYFKQELLERLATAEINKAQLYLNMKEPQAAAIYLKEFIKGYGFSKLYPRAHYMLMESYVRLDQFEQARTFHTKLVHEFPEVAKESKAISALEEINEAEKDFLSRIESEKEKKIRQRSKEL